LAQPPRFRKLATEKTLAADERRYTPMKTIQGIFLAYPCSSAFIGGQLSLPLPKKDEFWLPEPHQKE
jgi:hypothetical protein